MRIVIDLQGMQSPASGGRGVGRYTDNLVRQILIINKREKKHEIFLALNGAFKESVIEIRSKYKGLIDPEHIVVWQQFYDTTAYKNPGVPIVKMSKLSREIFLNSLGPDVIFAPNLQEGLSDTSITSVKEIHSRSKYVSTLHDVVPYYYEYLVDPITRDWYFSKINYAKNSDLVITVSETSKRQIVEKTGMDEDKISVIYNGYDNSLFNTNALLKIDIEEISKKYGICRPYFLYYGGADMHKNLENLILGYHHYRLKSQAPFYLVLGGSDVRQSEKISRLVEKLGLTVNVITPGYIDDADLPSIIKGAEAFVFPSMHEGFGLPALEAMACGVAAVGAKGCSVEEILQESSALFDGSSYLDIANMLDRLTVDEDFRKYLATSGAVRSQKFSWERAAHAFYQALEGLKLDARQLWAYDSPIAALSEYMGGQLDRIGTKTKVAISHSIAESFRVNRPRRIFIDISSVFAHDYKSGIQRVTRAICQEILNEPPESFDIVLIYSTPNDALFFEANSYLVSSFGINRSSDNSIAEMQQGDILLYLDLNPGVAISHSEHAQYLRAKGISVFHIIYDLLPLLKPETFWPELCDEFKAWMRVVSMSDGAICISRSVADELKAYLSAFGAKRSDPLKLGWFHLGADIDNSVPTKGIPDGASTLLRRIRNAHSFIMVGTIEPRKGHAQTIAAFDQLWKKGADDVMLVIVGRLGWGMPNFEDNIKSHPEFGSRLFWLSGISDEYLGELYEVSSCLIAASDGEGFGLPLIEAAQRSMPMIIRNIPVFKEVAGEHAEYFEDDKDPKVIADTLCSWLEKSSDGRHPRSDNMAWLTWRQSAKQLMHVILEDNWYSEAHGGGGIAPGETIDFRSRDIKLSKFNIIDNHYCHLTAESGNIIFTWRSSTERAYANFHLKKPHGLVVSIFLNDSLVFESGSDIKEDVISFGLFCINDGINNMRFEITDADLSKTISSMSVFGAYVKDLKICTLGKAVKSDTAIPFSSPDIDWQGFGSAESGFRWSAVQDPSISFFWDNPSANVQLSIAAVGYVKQAVTVSMNGTQCGSATIEERHPGDSTPDYIICMATVKPGYNIVDLDIPGAMNPGPFDDRMLGIAVRELTISPVSHARGSVDSTKYPV